MMKKRIVLLLAPIIATAMALSGSWLLERARAGVPCTLPFNLQNGQPADATQVMANYNALVTCLTQAAAAGVNSDITALTALTTPIPVSAGGTPVFVGGTSTGSANAQTVPVTTPNYVQTDGYEVTFEAGFTNTAQVTLTIGTTPARPLYRNTNVSLTPSVGGELVATNRYRVAYRAAGAVYVLMGETFTVGEIKDFASNSLPPGYLWPDGSCISRTTYAALFSIIGTSYDTGGCLVTHFALPDLRGRVTLARDNLGQGAANRVTNTAAGGSCNAAVIGGAGCGTASITQTAAQLAQHGHTITEPAGGQGHLHSYLEPNGGQGHVHAVNEPNGGQGHKHPLQNNWNTVHDANATNQFFTSGGGDTVRRTFQSDIISETAFATSGVSIGFSTTGISISRSPTGITIDTFPTAATTPMANLPPLQVVNKIIKF